MGCHFLLQGIFPTQGSNPSFPHFRRTLYSLSHWGSFLAPKCPLRCSDHFIPTMISAMEATAPQRSSLLTGPPGFPDYRKPLPLTGRRESFLNVSSDHTFVTGSLCLMCGTQGPSWVSPPPSSTPHPLLDDSSLCVLTCHLLSDARAVHGIPLDLKSCCPHPTPRISVLVNSYTSFKNDIAVPCFLVQ